jgi:pimeloyl-ACP methyl ester carboxylesterase
MKSTLALILVALTTPAFAQSIPPIERRLPPKGIAVDAAAIAQLEKDLATQKARLAKVMAHPLAADAEVFLKAVELALKYGEFYKKGDEKKAAGQIKLAADRIDALAAGKAPWTTQMNNVVRGYRSTIDGSVQPYGLVVPEKLDVSRPVPLYIWLHGRGDTATDLHFIESRMGTKPGQIVTEKGLVLHPFGRQCIGWKSAGEIDIFQAVDHVKSQYKIDENRITLMGFSMGGAGAWHVGAHYADRWAAVHAGAGFVDVKFYQKVDPASGPPWYEQAMWNLYDVPEYRRNFLNVPTIAYSGENDKQRATGEYMVKLINQERAEYVPHFIGKGVEHKYTPEGLAEVMRHVDAALARGRNTHPKQVHLQTRTLRYGRLFWVELLGLREHWQETRVDAELTSDTLLTIQTRNVASMRLAPPKAGWKQFPAGFEIRLDGSTIKLAKPAPTVTLTDGKLDESDPTRRAGLAKRPGLTGPIDDALYEPFLVVVPTGRASHEKVQQWVDFEIAHFADRWSSVYRGALRMKKDTQVTAEDMKNHHLICFGDPAGNAVIAKAAGKLPIRWDSKSVAVGGKTFSAASHVPLLIYPNPLQPDKYLVLNSGNTFRENADRTNSLQNPKLPDWAILDLNQPPNGDVAGKVVAADFFDEQWRVQPRVIDPNSRQIP